MRNIIFTAVIGLAGTTTALAQGDSSADVPGGFGHAVQQSQGVMIRVPVNAQGEENTNAAEIRVTNDRISSSADIPTAWTHGIDGSHQPILNRNRDNDSSTWGWYGSWYGWGWRPSYYYYSYYYPSYYYSGYYYNYYSPYYYNYYYSYPYYRYYYYGRYW